MRPRIPSLVAGAAVTAGAIALAVRKRRAALRRVVCSERMSPAELDAFHAKKVARIAAQLRSHPHTRPVSLRKQAPPHQVPKRGDLRRRDDKIDISDLTSILDIDTVRRTCTAESGVTFADLVTATLRYGLVPMVVPELETITVGGAVSGCSIESMSFRYGGFHDSCLEYEVITAQGDVLTCTPENQHALVFQMMHGAFGTLGILSKLVFKLVPARPFVHVSYEKYPTFAAYRAAILDHYDRGDVDFMDGIIHSPTEFVLSVANFVDHAPYTSRYDWMKVYYKSTRELDEDYLDTRHYLFRYNRGVTNVVPRSVIGRLVFGKVLDSTTLLRAAERVPWVLRREHPTVTLDVFVPISKADEFLRWYEQELGYFPLWCVPYKRVRDYEWISESFYRDMRDTLFLDLAIYGMKQRGDRNAHKLIEDKLRELGGIKTLISHNYYSRDEFWSTWNKRNYDTVKALTDPENMFRDLYTKTCRAAMGLDERG
ncbi:MAG TPA: FAD-binding oxidoreductase [Kofleriaceae bacterium]|nr:FAD-binding oxidoreductase [Kofleriaceae bacterium]